MVTRMGSGHRRVVRGAATAITGAVTTFRTQSSAFKRSLLFVGVGLATAVVLPLSVGGRPDEATFVHLYEAPSLLAGDHPYRDFFEWGAPLPAFMSAGVQWLVGYRLVGELVLQWTFTIVGVLLAFHLGLRRAGSTGPVLAVLPFILLVAARAGYHFSKLFCIPMGLWLAWRYLDRPTARRAAAMGVFTTVAFLFRHDFVIWVGLSSALALGLSRLVTPESRRVRSLIRDGGVYALAAMLTLAPWATLVGTSEGLIAYVEARAERRAYSRAAGRSNPYAALLQMNPAQLRTITWPAPEAGVASLEWRAEVDAALQAEIADALQWRPLPADGPGRVRYKVPNVFDPRLQELVRNRIQNDSGFDWGVMDAAGRNAPLNDGVLMWLAQVMMLVPLALIASGAIGTYRNRAGPAAARVGAAQQLLAGVVLAGVCQTLFREWSYFLVVAPVTAALGAQFLARPAAGAGDRPAPGVGRALRSVGVAVSIALLLLTTYAAAVWERPFWRWQGSISETARQFRLSMQEWFVPEYDGNDPTYAYLHDCTIVGDRLLLTGSTPYHAPYYTQRSIAGGHLDWSLGLRDAPELDAASLELLKRQSVPFVLGRRSNVIEQFDRYPQVRAYLAEYYTAVNGTDGTILYDTRRPVVSTYGPDRMPCFAGETAR